PAALLGSGISFMEILSKLMCSNIRGGVTLKINFSLLAFVILLMACSNTSEVETQSDPQSTEKNTVHALTSEQVNKYENNPQAPETDTLNTINQKFEDEDGKVILKALSNEEKNSMIGPVELTLNDIKALDY